MLANAPFIIHQLQPEESLAFVLPEDTTGWGGVYRWCQKALQRSNGAIEADILFSTYEVLVIHLDADVASEQYANAHIVDGANDLPCLEACPPASATTERLRTVMMRWIGAVALPGSIVLCTPSKNTEAWVLCALYLADKVVRSGSVECFERPQRQLQSKGKVGRLVSGGKKHVNVYSSRSSEISEAWPGVRALCTEAERFSDDFESAAT